MTQNDPNDIRAVPGHEGYFAGGDGQVYSNRQGGRMKPLSVSLVKGYPSTSLMVPGKKIGTRFYVHALVCAAFRGPRPSPAHEARHLDSDPLNSRESNLAWGTKAEQAADRRAAGRGHGGANCPRPTPSKRGQGANKTGMPPVDPAPIPGYEPYLASKDGRIFSGRSFPYMEMSLSDDGRGNPKVTLSGVKGLKSTAIRVCILVCLAFRGPKPSPAHEVLHADHDLGNCAESNLRWGTKAENMADRVRDGRLAGERNGRAVLTPEQAAEAAALVEAGSRHSDVGRKFGVHANTARAAHQKKLWGHLPPHAGPVQAIPAPPQEGRKGGAHPMAKLTEETAKSLIRAVHSGRVRREAAAEHGVDVATANKVYRGALWPHLQAYKASLGPETKSATGRRPENARTAKLTRGQVEEVRRLALAGEFTQPAIAEAFGISQAQVSSIKLGKAWRGGGEAISE